MNGEGMGPKTEVDRHKMEARQKKKEHQNLKTAAVRKAAVAKQIATDKSRKMRGTDQRTGISSRQQPRPSTALKQTTKGGTRKVESKEQKRKVTS